MTDFRVLHVDDDEDLLEVISRILEAKKDITVTTRTGADGALDYLRDCDYDVDCVVADYGMPGKNGIDLLREVREDCPNLPFILFTSKGSEEVASEAISAGVTDYIQKGGGDAQYDVLANRIRNYAEKYWREKDLEKSEEYRLKLYELTSSTELDSQDKVRKILQLGAERNGVENGYLTYIERETGRYEIVEVNGSHIHHQRGKVFDLSETYCRKIIDSDEILGFHNLVEQGWDGDPAQEKFDFGCYLGSKILVDDELYGTVCFADETPRDREFSHPEKAFVELVGRWLSYELQRTGGVEFAT